jgi:hypothetical protein
MPNLDDDDRRKLGCFCFEGGSAGKGHWRKHSVFVQEGPCTKKLWGKYVYGI